MISTKSTKSYFSQACLSIAMISAISISGCQTANVETSNIKQPSQVTIHRDQYGTPHIFSDSNSGVYFGYGYAVATDRMYQMEMLKRTTQGTVAQVLGEKYLPLDTRTRTQYDLPSVRQQVASLKEKDKQILQAYADGFNQRIDKVVAQPELLAFEFQQNDFQPQHWTAEDVAMIFIGSIVHRYADFNSELDNLQLLKYLVRKHGDDVQGRKKAWAIFNASKWLYDADSPTTVNASKSINIKNLEQYQLPFPAELLALSGDNDDQAHSSRVVLDENGLFAGTTSQTKAQALQQKLIAKNGFSNQPGFTGASNFWAVGSEKMTGANGALVNGPQFGWSVPSYVYGVGLHGGDFNVVGNTLLALPAMLFAHNNKIAWGSTAGLSDLVDVFAVRLNPKDKQQYWHDDQYKTMQSWIETIEVKGQQDVKVAAYKTAHGMVVSRQGQVAYSRARTWQDHEVATLIAWIDFSKAATIKQAQSELANITSNINFYMMDRAGKLAYTHGGLYPKRRPMQDSRLPSLGDGDYDWQGMKAYSQSPQAHIPTTNYIMNWNNRPAANWRSGDLWTYTWGRVDRGGILGQRLSQQATFTEEQLWKVVEDISYKDLSLPFLLPYLEESIAFCRNKESVQHSTSMSPEKSALVNQAIAQLQHWSQDWIANNDGNFGSSEAIMDAWIKQLLLSVFRDDVGEKFGLYSATNHPSSALGASKKSPLGVRIIIHQLDRMGRGDKISYDFFNNAEPAHVISDSFTQAISQLESKFGNDMSQWRLAAAPMHWKNTNFRGVPQADKKQEVKLPTYMNRGSENNLFIANSDGFTAYDVIPSGQSGHVNLQGEASVHTQDQVDLFQHYKYKAVPFSHAEVKAHSVSVEQLSY